MSRERSSGEGQDAGRDPGGRGKLSRNDPEVELWRGRYSPRAMASNWALCGFLTLAGAGLAMALPDPTIRLAIAAGVALAWLYTAATLIYRQLSIRYRLTSQRFFHDAGILSRTTNRIEVIDMDDITLRQGILDRILGVGTIMVTSSDRTDPTFLIRGIEKADEVAAMIDNARRQERLRRGMFIESV